MAEALVADLDGHLADVVASRHQEVRGPLDAPLAEVLADGHPRGGREGAAQVAGAATDLLGEAIEVQGFVETGLELRLGTLYPHLGETLLTRAEKLLLALGRDKAKQGQQRT